MAFLDYYKVLNIDKSATLDDIKKAYRKLARKYHPDLNPDDDQAKQRFQEINEANEVLSDPEKRQQYDQYGQNGPQYGRTGTGGSTQQQYTGNFDEAEFSDFFEQMFGSRTGGGRRTVFKGQDIQATLNLTLSDAAHTHQQTFTINGKQIRINIPAGVADGQKIKLTGLGAEGANNGPKGDLYITFQISNDARFKRDGNQLYTDLTLDLYTALLGGEMTIDTLQGKIKLKIKPLTPNGAKVRLKGKGFPIYKKEGQFGDLYVQFHVKLPEKLNDKQIELIKKIKAEEE